jgi:Sec-independent protein translocase protein TatA
VGLLELSHLLIVLGIALVVLGPKRLLAAYEALRRARDEFVAAREREKGEGFDS